MEFLDDGTLVSRADDGSTKFWDISTGTPKTEVPGETFTFSKAAAGSEQRAGRFLGGAQAARSSAPMLLIPVTVSAGTYTAFEVRHPGQRARREVNPGPSRID